MILGRIAVTILIFALTMAMQIGIIEAWTNTSAVDMTGWGCILSILICSYCTGSGLYLLIHFGYL